VSGRAGAGFLGLAATDPVPCHRHVCLFAFLGALASATQDVAIDAWRIDVADEQTSVELLSSIYQFGYRIASIVGARWRWSWPGG
jgi:PAT family beta-lactamase induction signal transducer AmpG